MLDLVIESEKKNQSQRQHEITIGVNRKLTVADAKQLAQQTFLSVTLSNESHQAITYAFEILKKLAAQRVPVYGLNTNFGDQVRYLDTQLKNDNADLYYDSINARQENIVKSLACSQGSIIAPEIIRVTMMLRAHCLAQGYSGVSPNTLSAILAYLNSGITPVVRCYGSIGASGDLIPLASIATCFLGENVPVMYKGDMMMAPKAMELAGLTKFKPQLRDGLALINGTSFMTAIASISLYDLKRLFNQMLAAIAMALESLLVINSAYHPLVHKLKYQSGENSVNDFMTDFWKGSQLLTDLDELRSASTAFKPVQDYYSLRAVPQGFGPFHENLETATKWIENEMNAVNDNPIVDVIENKIHHTANFMGYYVTEACDLLKTDIAQASTWLHALLANMVHPRKNHGLPVNLAINPDNQNGFRSMQLLAAALAVQNRKLAQSHQAYSLPTEGDNQDVNSLGTHAALDLQESVTNLERLTAIILLASAQALELRGIEKASDKAKKIYHIVREHSPTLAECRPMSEEIINVIQLLKDERF